MLKNAWMWYDTYVCVLSCWVQVCHKGLTYISLLSGQSMAGINEVLCGSQEISWYGTGYCVANVSETGFEEVRSMVYVSCVVNILGSQWYQVSIIMDKCSSWTSICNLLVNRVVWILYVVLCAKYLC